MPELAERMPPEEQSMMSTPRSFSSCDSAIVSRKVQLSFLSSSGAGARSGALGADFQDALTVNPRD